MATTSSAPQRGLFSFVSDQEALAAKIQVTNEKRRAAQVGAIASAQTLQQQQSAFAAQIGGLIGEALRGRKPNDPRVAQVNAVVQKATTAIQEAGIDPESPEALNMFGSVLEESGMHQEAQNFFSQALQRDKLQTGIALDKEKLADAKAGKSNLKGIPLLLQQRSEAIRRGDNMAATLIEGKLTEESGFGIGAAMRGQLTKETTNHRLAIEGMDQALDFLSGNAEVGLVKSVKTLGRGVGGQLNQIFKSTNASRLLKGLSNPEANKFEASVLAASAALARSFAGPRSTVTGKEIKQAFELLGGADLLTSPERFSEKVIGLRGGVQRLIRANEASLAAPREKLFRGQQSTEQPAFTQSNPATPTTQEDFNNLPAGTFFKNPADGRILIKKD